MSYWPYHTFPHTDYAPYFTYPGSYPSAPVNWRQDARGTGKSLASLISMIQNIQSVIVEDGAPGNEGLKRLLKDRKNEGIVDEVVGMLLQLEKQMAEKVFAMENGGTVARWNPPQPYYPLPYPPMTPLMETTIPRPPCLDSVGAYPRKRLRVDLPSKDSAPIKYGEVYDKDNYGFLNFPNIVSKIDQALKISELLKHCGINVRPRNVVVYESGPMYSAAYQNRTFISFDVKDDERAVQDLHRLFFHDKCGAMNKVNTTLFGSNASLYLTLVRGITPFTAYKFDMASRFFRYLKESYPPAEYTMVLNKGCLFINKKLSSDQEVYSCNDLYKKFPDVFDAEYHNTNYAGRRLLKKMTRRLDKSVGKVNSIP